MDWVSFTLPTGQKSFALYSDGVAVDSFNCYINDLASSAPKSTTVNTASDLKTFFIYLDALSDPNELSILTDNQYGTSLLTQIIHQFPLYLARGIESSDRSLAHLAATKTMRKPTSDSTNQRIISSLRGFLRSSAALQAEMLIASDNGLIDITLAPEVMFKESLFRQEMPIAQRKKLLKKSMIAGVVRGGPVFANGSLLKSRKVSIVKPAGSNISKALPYNDIIPLLNEATTLRDRCAWALMLGTGIRGIEAYSLLLEDINFNDREIYCVNPATRPLAYGTHFEKVNGAAQEAAAYKGRTTVKTLFIEPFRTIFFETCAQYLRKERAPLFCDHQLFFVALKHPFEGKPLILSDHKTRLFPFTKALDRVYEKRNSNRPQNLGLHACRHFYASYCLNYLPVQLANGNIQYGLNVYVVQQLMGHSSIESTLTYAIPDIEKVKIQAEGAMRQITKVGLGMLDEKILIESFGAAFGA